MEYLVNVKFEEIETRKKVYSITLYLSDQIFDYNFPFRPLLEGILEVAKQTDSAARIEIDPFEQYEDFIEAKFYYQSNVIDVYFEHSLVFLDFYSSNKEIIESLRNTLNGLKLGPYDGYGVDPL